MACHAADTGSPNAPWSWPFRALASATSQPPVSLFDGRRGSTIPGFPLLSDGLLVCDSYDVGSVCCRTIAATTKA